MSEQRCHLLVRGGNEPEGKVGLWSRTISEVSHLEKNIKKGKLRLLALTVVQRCF